jgi:hypothetical protein
MFRLLVSAGGGPLVIEAVGAAGLVEHRLALPAGHSDSLVAQLRAGLPGLAVEPQATRPDVTVQRAVSLRLTTKLRPVGGEVAEVSRALLTALAQAHKSEQVCLQWLLTRTYPAHAVPSRVVGVQRESWLGALLLAPFSPPPAADSELRQALSAKQGEAGWQVVGRIGVRSRTRARKRQLIGQVLGALRTSQAPGVQWWASATNPAQIERVAIPWRKSLRLNAREQATVAAWPVGVTSELPVKQTGSRLVPPAAAIPRTGRIVGESIFPGRERPLALSPVDALRHLHVLGPSGVGKSTLLLNLIEQDLAAGRAVVVIEPKGDLIADVLAHVPKTRTADVVLLDPTDTDRPVGLNPLYLAGRSPELVADQVLGLFHSLYAAHWGPRTADILGASLLTLARTPGMTLAALPVLLTNAAFRRRIVGKVSDPLALGSFWAGFEAWSERERTAAIAPTMNKLRPLLMRPELRAIIGQAQPRFDLRRVFTERKVLLVNLAAGQLGPEASALLGSLVIAQLWQAILGRSAMPPERRSPVMVVLDEFQTYLHLPVDLSDALAQARGLGAGFTLAHQFLHQLDPAMRASVLANAQSRVAFRLPADDARLVAAGSLLTPEDFQSLGAYQCYVQLVAQASVQAWASARSLPPSQPTSDPALIRTTSRLTYGIDRAQIEAELIELVGVQPATSGDDLRPRRRQQKPEARP